MTALYVRAGDAYSQAPPQVVIDSARSLLTRSFRKGAQVMKRPEVVEAFLAAQLSTREHEVFAVILLDANYRLIKYLELFHGDVTGATVHTGEVVKVALMHNAMGVILAHNHPSGHAEPSEADVLVTRRLKAALDLVSVRVVDHFVIGETVTSFVRRGLLFE